MPKRCCHRTQPQRNKQTRQRQNGLRVGSSTNSGAAPVESGGWWVFGALDKQRRERQPTVELASIRASKL